MAAPQHKRQQTQLVRSRARRYAVVDHNRRDPAKRPGRPVAPVFQLLLGQLPELPLGDLVHLPIGQISAGQHLVVEHPGAP